MSKLAASRGFHTTAKPAKSPCLKLPCSLTTTSPSLESIPYKPKNLTAALINTINNRQNKGTENNLDYSIDLEDIIRMGQEMRNPNLREKFGDLTDLNQRLNKILKEQLKRQGNVLPKSRNKPSAVIRSKNLPQKETANKPCDPTKDVCKTKKLVRPPRRGGYSSRVKVST